MNPHLKVIAASAATLLSSATMPRLESSLTDNQQSRILDRAPNAAGIDTKRVAHLLSESLRFHKELIERVAGPRQELARFRQFNELSAQETTRFLDNLNNVVERQNLGSDGQPLRDEEVVVILRANQKALLDAGNYLNKVSSAYFLVQESAELNKRLGILDPTNSPSERELSQHLKVLRDTYSCLSTIGKENRELYRSLSPAPEQPLSSKHVVLMTPELRGAVLEIANIIERNSPDSGTVDSLRLDFDSFSEADLSSIKGSINDTQLTGVSPGVLSALYRQAELTMSARMGYSSDEYFRATVLLRTVEHASPSEALNSVKAELGDRISAAAEAREKAADDFHRLSALKDLIEL